jgi:hypothetical protein
MGVPIMARPRQTATTETPTRAPRKPAGKSTGNRPASGPQKARNRRESVSKPTTAKAPNKFDAVAAAVASGDDDLARQLAASIGHGKGKAPTAPKATAKGKPAKDNGKVDPKPKATTTKATSNGVTFAGRPTSNQATIAARAKEAGLRIRKDADPADIASRLRATVEATTAWLDSRNGSAPAPKAKATATAPKAPAPKAPAPKAKASKAPVKDAPAPKEPKAPTILVGHRWSGPVPDGLPEIKGCTLAVRYTVQLDDGLIVSQLWGIRDADGKHITDAWQWPLDFRPKVETSSRGRKVTLKDKTKAGLQAWLAKEGLIDK